MGQIMRIVGVARTEVECDGNAERPHANTTIANDNFLIVIYNSTWYKAIPPTNVLFLKNAIFRGFGHLFHCKYNALNDKNIIFIRLSAGSIVSLMKTIRNAGDRP